MLRVCAIWMQNLNFKMSDLSSPNISFAGMQNIYLWLISFIYVTEFTNAYTLNILLCS